MKTVLLLLVILAVAARPAWALQCHVCSNTSNCKGPQLCSASSRFCKTTLTVDTLSGNLVKKECADFCEPSSNLQGQVSSGSATTLCCRHDLCNRDLSSAAAPSRATLSLTLALGVLTLMLVPIL